MEQNIFKFRVKGITYGWCSIEMVINDKLISFVAGYIQINPLESFIDACREFLVVDHAEDYDLSIFWAGEPGAMKIDLRVDKKGMLHCDIVEYDDDSDDANIEGEWHEVIPFDIFVKEIVKEGFRVLNAFGLYGYKCSWMCNTEFPVSTLLRITEEIKPKDKDDSKYTNISKELELIQKYISKLEITEETKLDSCTLYYESWQIQCCGDPFAVGDRVEWTCIMSEGYRNAHGTIIDFEEDHHGFATHAIEGVVAKIVAERSEFPEGKREVWYEKAETIKEELQHADGWESAKRDDDTTERIFWGYIVELKDVTVSPLEENERK